MLVRNFYFQGNKTLEIIGWVFHINIKLLNSVHVVYFNSRNSVYFSINIWFLLLSLTLRLKRSLFIELFYQDISRFSCNIKFWKFFLHDWLVIIKWRKPSIHKKQVILHQEAEDIISESYEKRASNQFNTINQEEQQKKR